MLNYVTVITPRDGDEDGYHETFPVCHSCGRLSICEDCLISKSITETPMYIVLGMREDEKEHECIEQDVIFRGGN